MSDNASAPASAPSAASTVKSMDEIVALCRRRGFIFQSSEIYGGINGFWDYGPLGAELKRNLKNAWWQDIVQNELIGPDGKPVDIVGLDSTIIMNPKVWEASGHVGGFNDPMVDDKETKQRFRADHAWVVGFMLEDHFRTFREIMSIHAAKLSVIEQNLPILDALSKTGIDLPQARTLLPEFFGQLAELDRDVLALEPNAGLPTFYVAVEAASAGEAHEVARSKLTKRQREQIGDDPTSMPFNQIDLPKNWPRLSPATQKATLTEPRQFNLMFQTYVGAVQSDDSKAYLRPETAQGIFCNFWNVVDTSRVKVPFGIAQQGKAFRNEVTPRNFTFRSREFEQMEIEFFIHPDTANEWYTFWRDNRYAWWQSIGLKGENLQLREHEKDELAHYAKGGAGTSDIEYRFPFTAPGFGELEGVAHRADFDLKAHANACGKGDKLMYFDQDLQVKLQGEGVAKEEINKRARYFPHVIEPSAGADRGTLALLCEAFTPDASRASGVFMKFHPRMAPIKAAVFPLVNKDGMPEIAEKLYRQLRSRWVVQFDEKQSIGKRYARMDEAGTPYCFTIDSDTLSDQTVTVRHRDTQQQDRIGIDRVSEFLAEHVGA